MIPKVIHYCWFGGNRLPKLARKCISSWKKYCSNYEIIQWNEKNYNFSTAPLYVQQAYAAKKWAFVSDYVRLQIIYENGGIYLDTDVELIKSLDSLLDNGAFFGFETNSTINTGLGFGAEKGAQILKEIMADYEMIPFMLDNGQYDLETCTVRNTRVFVRKGLQETGEEQILENRVRILPVNRLRPFDDWRGTLEIAPETISIHWYNASWQPKSYIKAKKMSVRNVQKAIRKEKIRYFPKYMARKIFGNAIIDKLKEYLQSKSE